MKRLLRIATLALWSAAAAAPLAAGPIYVPIVVDEIDGAYQRSTDLWVTNPDAAIQGFVIRRISAAADGTVRATGDELGPYYLAPGESRRYTDLGTSGAKVMLEVDGASMLQFNAVLTTRTLQGIKVAEAEVPVLTQADLSPANGSLTLQGWERIGTTVTTNLGIVNASHSDAQCTIAIRERSGLLVIQNVVINLEPLTVVQFDDALGILGLITVVEGARAEITCNQSFWSFISVYNDQNGAVEFFEPSSSVGKSTLVEPVGSGGGGGGDTDPNAVVFELPGVFLNCTPCDHYRYNMSPPGEFRKIVLDFDVHVGNWDSHRPNGFHNVLWIQNGQSWGNMIGYINSKGTQGRMTFQVNLGVNREANQNPGLVLGHDYHFRYAYDMIAHRVWYEIYENGSLRTRGEYTISSGIRSINPGGFFAAFGGQSAAGPEAATRNWRFSNLVAQFIP